jgi:hypothetical protein
MLAAASGCRVLVCDLDDYRMWMCKIGETKWYSCRYHVYQSDRIVNIAEWQYIKAVGDKIYFEIRSDTLGVIELNGKEGLKLNVERKQVLCW